MEKSPCIYGTLINSGYYPNVQCWISLYIGLVLGKLSNKIVVTLYEWSLLKLLNDFLKFRVSNPNDRKKVRSRHRTIDSPGYAISTDPGAWVFELYESNIYVQKLLKVQYMKYQTIQRAVKKKKKIIISKSASAKNHI